MKKIEWELLEAGASPAEARDLAALASRLTRLPSLTRGKSVAATGKVKWKWAFGGAALASFAAGMLVIVLAQSVLPGSFLFPVQQTTDAAIVHAQPQYRATVMMKRAGQVQQLVARHASQQTVATALADYQAAANSYKTMRTNYAAFEYCESTLRQAAKYAPPAEQAAIKRTLRGLDDV